MKKLVQSLFLLILIASVAIAQERTVTGVITSKDDGLPLPGVSVVAKGTKVAVQTNSDGKYAIKVPSNVNQLVFTYIGFTSKTLTVTGNSLNVSLESDAKALSEVVVVGYGTQKRGEITGAVSSVKG
jgi:hypothetical protein